MANAYSQPQRGQYMQTYVSQHVPMPFEAIQHAIAAKNEQAEKVAQYTENAITMAGNIKALAGADSKYVKAKQDDINAFADSLTGQDLTDPEVIRSVRHKVAEIAQDGNLSKIQSMYTKAEQLRKNIDDMKKDGHYAAENVWAAEKALAEYTKDDKGFASGIDFDPTIIKGVDIAEGARKWYSMIQASGGDRVKSLSADLASGNAKVYYKDGQYGISSDKIGSVTANNLSEMINSQEGQQLIRRYAMEQDRAGKDFKPQEAAKYVFDTFNKIGQSYTFSKTETNRDVALGKLQDKKEESATQPGMIEEYATKFLAGSKTPEFDEKGNIKGKGSKTLTDYIFSDGWGAWDKWTKDNGLNKEQAEQFKPIMVGAKASGMTPAEYYKAMKKNISLRTEDYVKASTAENASKIVWNQGGGNWHSLMVIGKDGKKTSMAQFVKNVTDIDPDEDMEGAVEALKNKGFQISGELDANPYVAKGAYGNIGSQSFIIDYSGSRATSKDLQLHKIEKIKAEGLLEETVRDNGKSVKKLYIWDPKQQKILVRTEDDLK